MYTKYNGNNLIMPVKSFCASFSLIAINVGLPNPWTKWMVINCSEYNENTLVIYDGEAICDAIKQNESELE